MQPGTWNETFDWTRDEFENVTKQAFVVEKLRSVDLDVEHSSRKNMNDLICWAKESGYNAEERNSDTIRVYKIPND